MRSIDPPQASEGKALQAMKGFPLVATAWRVWKPPVGKGCSLATQAGQAPPVGGSRARTMEAGQALPLLLVAMALGVILISALLYAVDARLVTARVQVARAREQYAAGAAVEFALAQLRNGSYCGAPGTTTVFTLPASVNDVTANATARCVAGATSGGTWVTQAIPTTADLNGIYCLDANHCWAVGNSGTMLASSDGGVTWSPQYTSFPPPKNVDGIVFANLTCGWAVGEHTFKTIQWTTDGGANWNLVDMGSLHPDSLFAVAYDGVSRAWAVGSVGVVVRVDCAGVLQEESVPAGPDLRAVDFVNANNGWVVGLGGTIYHTANGAGVTTWSRQTVTTTADLYGVHFETATRGWAVGAAGTIWYTNNAGAAWTKQPVTTANTLRSISFSDPSNGWIVGENGTALKSTDGGLTWLPADLPIDSTVASINFSDPTHGWIVGTNGVLLRLVPGGGPGVFDIAGTANAVSVSARVAAGGGQSSVLSWQVR